MRRVHSQVALRLRDLENRMDKAQLKCSEAEHIRRTYEQIRAKLEEDSIHYPNTLDKLEFAIRSCCSELKELQAMTRDAQMCKDTAIDDVCLDNS